MKNPNITATLQLAICMLCVIVGSVGVISFSIFSPRLIETFDTSVSTTSLAVTIIMMLTGLGAPVIGRLLDTKPIRSLLLAGGAFLSVGLIAASFANSISALLASYVLIGVGVSLCSPMVATKHMTVWFPDRLGFATGLVVLPIGAVIFPPLTQALIDHFGWRSSYMIYSLIAVVTTCLILGIRAQPSATDIPENIATTNEDMNSDGQTAKSLSSLLIYSHLLRAPTFMLVVFGICIFIATPVSFMSHMIVLVQSKGLSADQGVTLLTAVGFSSLIGGPVAGVLSDKFGPHYGYVVIGLVQGLALLLVSGETSFSELMFVALIVGGFMSSSYVFFVGLLTTLVGSNNFGAGMGLGTLLSAVVVAIMPTVAGMMYDTFGNFDLFFLIIAALTIGTGLGSWFMGEPEELVYQ